MGRTPGSDRKTYYRIDVQSDDGREWHGVTIRFTLEEAQLALEDVMDFPPDKTHRIVYVVEVTVKKPRNSNVGTH